MLLEIVLCVVLLIVVCTFDLYFHFNVIVNLLFGLCRRQCKVTDPVSIYRFSSTYNTDLTLAHLNNVKYVMYMDFAKAHFWSRTRLLSFLWRVRAFPLQSATIIRYMRPIPIYSLVRIDTQVQLFVSLIKEWIMYRFTTLFQLVWWDERMIYLEHKFVIQTSETIAAISMSRMCFERHPIGKVLEMYPGGVERPKYPERLGPWIEALTRRSSDLVEI